jgi:hypothetical protein
MAFHRHALAHLALVLSVAAALAGCSSSHVDTPPSPDSGEGDLGTLDAGANDAGPDAAPADGGPPSSCSAQDAREIACPPAICDGLDGWYWNGDRCFSIPCGTCEGADCSSRVFSQAECEAAHATCQSTVCRATGGDWLFWAQECGHYVCGHSVPAMCLVGYPVCDCGPTSVFDPALGCVADPACLTDPPTPTREALCTGSGGSWEGICCDTDCGDFCPLACASLACNCGAGKIFDDARGCIGATRCHERTLGQTCAPDARCASGTICCQSCGGAGCFGPATCRAPTCSTDPAIDECGNNRMAP